MSYTIKLTDNAKRDIREIAGKIADYLLTQSGDGQVAKNFITELQNKTKQLTDLPDSGALPKDRFLLTVGYRYLLHKDYMIFYSTDAAAQTVFILAVFRAGRDYPLIMKGYL